MLGTNMLGYGRYGRILCSHSIVDVMYFLACVCPPVLLRWGNRKLGLAPSMGKRVVGRNIIQMLPTLTVTASTEDEDR